MQLEGLTGAQIMRLSITTGHPLCYELDHSTCTGEALLLVRLVEAIIYQYFQSRKAITCRPGWFGW